MSGRTLSPIGRLAEAIAYPTGKPWEYESFCFQVDDVAVQVVVLAHRLVLRCTLACSEEYLPVFAQYAAGRMLREDAVLAWDPRTSELFLWQEIPEIADAGTMRQCFETFVDACEWWLARVAELGTPETVFPDIMIRP